jgi:hypothetical protein
MYIPIETAVAVTNVPLSDVIGKSFRYAIQMIGQINQKVIPRAAKKLGQNGAAALIENTIAYPTAYTQIASGGTTT